MFNAKTGILPYFFMGEVVNKDDPLNSGRVKVRVFGVHPTHVPDTDSNDKEELDDVQDDDLPWAMCINGTYGKMNFVPDLGEWVFGFFLDGREAQHPMLLGTVPGQNTDTNVPASSVASDSTNTRNPSAIADGDTGAPLTDAAAGPTGGRYTSRAELEADPEFQAQLNSLLDRYPNLSKEDVYRVMQGESGFNLEAYNSNSGATGLFQFIPTTANELGYTTAEIQAMSASQQLSVYGEYLQRWDYGSGAQSGLGIMQAAPAYANRPGNAEVYSPGTKAYVQNPGWIGSDGRITVNSINSYYNNQRLA